MASLEKLKKDCQKVLSDQGRLTTAIPGFKARAAQIELASAIAEAIDTKDVLIAEAGTGLGKTFAYLIPSLLSDKKVLISTATKTLQDQLFQKDLPLLIKALGLSFSAQNLKGRSNYLCRYRIQLHAEEGRFISPTVAHEVLLIREKLGQFVDGLRSELPEISETSQVWPLVTSTVDNCLGNECEYYQDCFLVKARKRALTANIVVINHHLFFADSRLKEEGFGELLPGVDIVVFDEAHQLAEIATNFHGFRVGTRQIRELVDDILTEWPVLELANQPLKELSINLDKLIDELVVCIDGFTEKITWDELSRNKQIMPILEKMLAIIDKIIACFEGISFSENSGLKRCFKRLEDLKKALLQFFERDKNHIRWLERFKHHLVFHATPYDIADSFNALLTKQEAAYIFTSATLTVASSFDCFIKPLGLNTAKTLQFASAFNFQEQALLYLPRELPDPKDDFYYKALVAKAIPIIEACKGRTFFLFTSHRALKIVAELLSNHLNYPLLIQGDEAKPILLARFRQLGNAVLLGTATFWEGVDVKGEALSCVIIDKLPFANPSDPIVQGKMAYLKSLNLSGFDELSLPNAVLALKQGVGRLIRDVEDKGILMIADPRLTGRDYGQQIFASLPPIPKTRDEQKVLTFIENFISNESTGN
ncbi:MAG: ATP-dependent DNA helicase [Proteobacteria bacterium]|nr:ATP-dependent DNA helicase [Pseudomonadota bacterium]